MGLGTVHLRTDDYDHWTPGRINALNAWLQLGEVKQEHHTDKEYIWHVDHPDCTEPGEHRYFLTFDKHYNGYNTDDYISMVYTVNPDGTEKIVMAHKP